MGLKPDRPSQDPHEETQSASLLLRADEELVRSSWHSYCARCVSRSLVGPSGWPFWLANAVHTPVCSAVSELNPTPARPPTCFSDPYKLCNSHDAPWTRRLTWTGLCTSVSGALPERPDITQAAASRGDTGLSLDGGGMFISIS